MKGSAPNSPATGSQLLVRQNLKPNRCSESDESFASVMPMATTISSSAAAKTPMPIRNRRSVERTARLRHLDPVERRLFQHDDVGWQGSVAKIRRVLLSVGQRPLQEIHHGVAGALVHRILIQQNPRERRDRICAGALGI